MNELTETIILKGKEVMQIFLRWEQKKCAAFPLIVFPIESIPRRLFRIVKHRNNLDNLCGLARKSRYKSLLEASRRDAHIINKINHNQQKKHRTSVQMLSNLVAKFIPKPMPESLTMLKNIVCSGSMPMSEIGRFLDSPSQVFYVNCWF